jgi:hypothetical protein
MPPYLMETRRSGSGGYEEHVSPHDWHERARGQRRSTKSREPRRPSPPTFFHRSDEEVAVLFATLAAEWRSATGFESSLERKVLNRAYQRIIGLGPQVVPYILDDLNNSPDHWYWALTAIVGEDKAAGQMTMTAAAEAWLAWGRSIGKF